MKDDNAIYLVSRIYPNTNGGTQHNIGTCHYLSRFLNMTVISLLDRRYEVGDAVKDLADYDFDVLFHYPGSTGGYKERFCMLEPVDQELMTAIIQLIYEKSASYLFFTLKMLPYARKLQKIYPELRTVYISHNAEFMNIVSDLTQYDRIHHVNPVRHAIKLIQARAFMGKEGVAIRRSDQIFSISNRDSEVLAQRYHVDGSKLILNKPMIQYMPRACRDKWRSENYTGKLLIVGNMSWYPTVKGTRYFIEHIYAGLKEQYKELQLFIVGARPAQELIDIARSDPSIVLTGYVDSVKEYYEQCDIAIVPIYEGTGAKLKVLEALGNHIPVVMTGYVAKDYEGVGQAAIVAENDKELADGIQKLIGSEELRRQMCEREAIYYSQYMKENRYVDRFFEGCKENSATE